MEQQARKKQGVDSWLESLRTKVTAQSAQQKNNKKQAQEVYKLNFSDVKGDGNKIFDSSNQAAPIIPQGTGWQYNTANAQGFSKGGASFNNNFSSGNYGTVSQTGNGQGFGGMGGFGGFNGKSNSLNGFVGDSLQSDSFGTTKVNITGNINNSMDSNGWYDMYTYQNGGQGYFLPQSYWGTELTDFGTLGPTSTYTLVDGKWVITHEGDAWINSLPSAGGKQFVGNSI